MGKRLAKNLDHRWLGSQKRKGIYIYNLYIFYNTTILNTQKWWILSGSHISSYGLVI